MHSATHSATRHAETNHAPLSPVAPRDPALDGVRGLAILIVVVHNASWIEDSQATLPLKLFMAIAATGWVGVTLFFVLSGVLITGILLDTRDEPHYFRSFYMRRTLRIFPLYYVFLALVFTLGPYLVHDAAWRESVHDQRFWYWAYLSNWRAGIEGLPQFWSLAVEEQFYLVWPLLVFVLGGRRLLWLAIAMIATGPLIRYGLRFEGLQQGAYEFTIARWDALAVGAAIAVLLRHPPGQAWLERNAARAGAALVGALLVLVVFNRGFPAGELVVDVLGQSLVALFFGALVVMSIVPRGTTEASVRRFMSAGWLRFFGTYSYAIYVFHATLHRVARVYLVDVVNRGGTTERLLRLVAYDAAILGASLLLALGSWHLLEKYALWLKDCLVLGFMRFRLPTFTSSPSGSS